MSNAKARGEDSIAQSKNTEREALGQVVGQCPGLNPQGYWTSEDRVLSYLSLPHQLLEQKRIISFFLLPIMHYLRARNYTKHIPSINSNNATRTLLSAF